MAVVAPTILGKVLKLRLHGLTRLAAGIGPTPVSTHILWSYLNLELHPLSRDSPNCFGHWALRDRSYATVVSYPLAQTGEGISECEMVTWFVKVIQSCLWNKRRVIGQGNCFQG